MLRLFCCGSAESAVESAVESALSGSTEVPVTHTISSPWQL